MSSCGSGTCSVMLACRSCPSSLPTYPPAVSAICCTRFTVLVTLVTVSATVAVRTTCRPAAEIPASGAFGAVADDPAADDPEPDAADPTATRPGATAPAVPDAGLLDAGLLDVQPATKPSASTANAPDNQTLGLMRSSPSK